MGRRTKRKIVKIEDIIRDKKDFVINPKYGKYEIRAKYANRKVDLPLEDKLRFITKTRNICITCHNVATKLVYLEIKGGGVQLERYCPGCFDQVVDLDKMVMKPLDNSHLVIVNQVKGPAGVQ
jgi:hypothetical protein